MKKILLIVLMGMFFVSMTSALITIEDPFAQGDCGELEQTCSNCTFVYVTKITYPNGTVLYPDEPMTKNNVDYNYTFCSTDLLGSYKYVVLGDKDGTNQTEPGIFEVTPNGVSFDLSQGLLYIIMEIVLVFLFVLSLYFSITIPWKNYRDEEDNIVGMNDKKYLKLFLAVMSYLLLMFILGLTRSVLANFLLFQGAHRVFEMGYTIMLSLMYPIIVVSFVFMIIALIQDKKIRSDLGRLGSFNPR